MPKETSSTSIEGNLYRAQQSPEQRSRGHQQASGAAVEPLPARWLLWAQAGLNLELGARVQKGGITNAQLTLLRDTLCKAKGAAQRLSSMQSQRLWVSHATAQETENCLTDHQQSGNPHKKIWTQQFLRTSNNSLAEPTGCMILHSDCTTDVFLALCRKNRTLALLFLFVHSRKSLSPLISKEADVLF